MSTDDYNNYNNKAMKFNVDDFFKQCTTTS